MERMEALSGAVEALRYGYDEQSGAVRLLEHLAIASAPPTNRWRSLPGMPAAGRC
jgi:hypothetical protein